MHPTAPSRVLFTMDNFLDSDAGGRSIVHLGWWLRKFHTFFRLRTKALRKCLVHLDYPWVNGVIRTELSLAKGQYCQPYDVIPFLPPAKYDDLLSRSIVYLDLYDASACNVIVECIVRHTPLVVPKLAAVVEYLGADYPLYLTSDHAEISRDLDSTDRICAAHEYLRRHSQSCGWLAGKSFATAIEESTIFRDLGER